MKSSLRAYMLVGLVFMWFFVSFGVVSQTTKQDTINLIKTYQKEGLTAISKQEYDEAVIKLKKAYKLSSYSKDPSLKADVQLSIAELNFYLQNYNQATIETNHAINLFRELNDEKKLGESFNLYGLVLTKTDNYNEAERYFNDANIIFIKFDDEPSQTNVILGLGILELKKGSYQKAINYFDAAIPLFQSFNFKYQEAYSHLSKAEALLHMTDNNLSLQNAKAELDIAIQIIDSRSYSKLKVESYRINSQIAMRKNNLAESERFFLLYTKKKDSMYQVFMSAISKGIEVETSDGDQNEIIAEQQDDLNKMQRSINFGRLTTGLSIALIIILSLLTLSLYKNNNLRAKANELLQDKNNELQLAKEKAEKASLAKAQFLSTITHELRTPLYAVTGLTHLLLEEDPTPEQKEHLDSLKFSGEYLLSLINNILDLNKLEANKVEVEKTPFSLEKRINDVIVTLKKSADDKKNNIYLEFDNEIPEELLGDPLKLSQILINLIGNSLKFTQNGDVVVRVNQLERSETQIVLHFEVEDNGVGISKKKQKSIFETFSQASLQINRKFGGTGLGLSIVKNLLELMGSKIHLESQLGKGSLFWFDLALDISEKKNSDYQKNVVYDVDYKSFENKNVLIVEDNKINQMITKKILEKNKMKCMVADNGMDAIKLVKENDYDIILMDIHMPGISGIETTQKIRDFNKQIPILALTAVTIDENLDEFYHAGFNEIIPKPFKTEEFFEKIYRSMLEKNQSVRI